LVVLPRLPLPLHPIRLVAPLRLHLQLRIRSVVVRWVAVLPRLLYLLHPPLQLRIRLVLHPPLLPRPVAHLPRQPLPRLSPIRSSENLI